MSKEILFGDEAKQKLINGVNILADSVKSTLGAAGNTVIYQDPFGNPKVTKDGVTVAKEIFLEDAIENMGAQIVKQAASKTASEAGDGTTTATVIAQSIINNGIKNEDFIQVDVNRAMAGVSDRVIEYIKSKAVKVDNEKLLNVATISANNDEELGEIISSAFIEVGNNGVVTMEESKTSKTYVDFVEGMEVKRGYLSRYHVTDEKKDECVLHNPLVFISDVKIQRMDHIFHLIQYAAENNRSIFIISEMEDNVLNTITLNKIKSGLRVGVINPPMFGVKRKELLEDISVLSNAVLISDETGDDFTNIDFSVLGSFDKVTIGKLKTTMISEQKSPRTVEKIKFLNEKLKEEEYDENKEWLEERIANLDGKVGIVYVGAASEAELNEKKDRVDDAISATKAALEEGIIAGGGIALYDASIKINDPAFYKQDGSPAERYGQYLITSAIQEPFNRIIENAGKDLDEIEFEIFTKSVENYGYDVKTETYGDMFQLGIIDPLKVTRNALENAVSVASTILSTGCTITIKDDGRR